MQTSSAVQANGLNHHTTWGQSHANSSPQAARCSGSDLLRWSGLMHEVNHRSDEIVFPMRRIRSTAVLVHEGTPFESLYFISTGAFKTVHTDADGYELVQDFLSRGDAIGLDGLCDGTYGADAVALEDSSVAIVTFRDLLSAARSVPALEQLLLLSSGREIRRKNQTLEVVAAVGAEVRLARFLLQLIERQVEQGYSSRCMLLRMSRRDIASHLGIAHETVSRSLTALSDWGYIEVRHREIEILDHDGLDRFKRVTRGPTERPAGGRGGVARRARILSNAAQANA